MAASVPGQPTFVTASERDVWGRLCKQLGDDCVVLANYRVSDKHKHHEADLVALMPGSGFVVIEVKGSHVWLEPDGRWMINRANGAEPIHPVEQARDATYALRSCGTSDPRWGTDARSLKPLLARTELADDLRNTRQVAQGFVSLASSSMCCGVGTVRRWSSLPRRPLVRSRRSSGCWTRAGSPRRGAPDRGCSHPVRRSVPRVRGILGAVLVGRRRVLRARAGSQVGASVPDCRRRDLRPRSPTSLPGSRQRAPWVRVAVRP